MTLIQSWGSKPADKRVQRERSRSISLEVSGIEVLSNSQSHSNTMSSKMEKNSKSTMNKQSQIQKTKSMPKSAKQNLIKNLAAYQAKKFALDPIPVTRQQLRLQDIAWVHKQHIQ